MSMKLRIKGHPTAEIPFSLKDMCCFSILYAKYFAVLTNNEICEEVCGRFWYRLFISVIQILEISIANTLLAIRSQTLRQYFHIHPLNDHRY